VKLNFARACGEMTSRRRVTVGTFDTLITQRRALRSIWRHFAAQLESESNVPNTAIKRLDEITVESLRTGEL